MCGAAADLYSRVRDMTALTDTAPQLQTDCEAPSDRATFHIAALLLIFYVLYVVHDYRQRSGWGL